MKRPLNGFLLVFDAARPHHAHMRIVPLLIVVGAACFAEPGWAADAAGTPARNVVVGTGDPNLDVPAVQAAVDQGGQVLLRGHFSFDRPPSAPNGFGFLHEVLVSREVVISGTQNEQGEMTTIEGGDVPFDVEAPGAHVAIQGLRFLRPRRLAISVFAVSGLVIANCRIEHVESAPLRSDPAGGLISFAILVTTTLHVLPTPDQPGQPENISGTLSIFDNNIDAVGTAGLTSLGIFISSVGKSPDREVEIHLSGNTIRNTTERALNIQQIGGRVYIERNVITTSANMRPGGGVTALVDAIKCQGSGSYLVAHNRIDSAWANGAGIRLRDLTALGAAMERAIVVDNDVTMSAPPSVVFGANSAAIEIRGLAQGNVVLNNRIRGRAGTALAVVAQGLSVPANNTFAGNDIEGFHPSLADVFVDAGVANTLVVGRKGTVRDRGVGTVIVNPGTTASAGRQKAELMATRGKEK
jgi:hypothetical protein